MARVLIVYHSLSGNTKAAAEAVAEGAKAGGADPVLKEGLQAGPEDLRACDAIAIGTPDYFSYMAGGLKDFFDRSFYPTQGQVVDKPCGIFVTHVKRLFPTLTCSCPPRVPGYHTSEAAPRNGRGNRPLVLPCEATERPLVSSLNAYQRLTLSLTRTMRRRTLAD